MVFLNSRNYVVNKTWFGTSSTSFGIGSNALNVFTQNPASDWLDHRTWTFHIFVSRTAHQVRWYHNPLTVTLLKALWSKSRNFCIENALGMNVFLPDHRNTVCRAFNESVQSTLKHGPGTSYLARWENWYAAGNFGEERLWDSFAVTRSDSESIFQHQFARGEYHGYGGCYYLTRPRGRVKSRNARSSRSQVC